MMNGQEKSDSGIVAVKPTNKTGQPGAELAEPRPETKGNVGQQSTLRTQGRERVSQALGRVRQAARQRKKEKFTALLHHITVDTLRGAYYALQRKAAPGVDGVTWEDYEAELEPRLANLHGRVHRGAYRPQPSRRTYIPKADGKQRPLAIAALEDKIVQGATVMVLNAIYEEEFLGLSYGFRPGRGPHDALDALVVGITRRKVHWILDAATQTFLRKRQPRMAGAFPGTPDRRQAHHPPDPEMAQGGHPGRRGGEGKRHRDGARSGGTTPPGQYLHVLRLRSLGRALATPRGHGRHDHGALCRRLHRRVRARGRRPALPGGTARADGEVLTAPSSEEAPAYRVRPLRGGKPQSARARQAGDLQFPGFHLHLRHIPPRQLL